MATDPTRPIRIPNSALEELAEVELMDLSLTMDDLVVWVNEVVRRFVPEAGRGDDRRVSGGFTARTLRHYQTLGCLDAPEKVGKEARYGFRHYLQALMIRKLLHERVAAERIQGLMDGRTNDEYKELLFHGIELVARRTDGKAGGTVANDPPVSSAWLRIPVAAGVEIHLREHTARPKPAELKQWLRTIETALRQHL